MADYGRWTTSSSAIGAYWRKKERQQKLETQRRRQRAREVLAHQANKEYFDSNVLQRPMGLTTTKKGAQREAFAAALFATDRALGLVVDALVDNGMLGDATSGAMRSDANGILVVHSDNGGFPCAQKLSGSNHPYRGCKFNWFEGGIKVPAFIYGPGVVPAVREGASYEASRPFFHASFVPLAPPISRTRRGLFDRRAVSFFGGRGRPAEIARRLFFDNSSDPQGLMHHVDWTATFLKLAGVGDPADPVDGLPDVDAVDVWPLFAAPASAAKLSACAPERERRAGSAAASSSDASGASTAA